jgi:regulator of sirC expression with transglutaminase-like and TPR domain
MVGVNIPAHFFISPADPQLEFLVDPFGGSISFLQDAEETLARIAGTKIVLDPAFITAKQPMPPRVFLARWLNNLAAVYANVQQDWASAYAISQYMLATRPGDVDVLRDSGVLLYRGKRFAGVKPPHCHFPGLLHLCHMRHLCPHICAICVHTLIRVPLNHRMHRNL